MFILIFSNINYFLRFIVFIFKKYSYVKWHIDFEPQYVRPNRHGNITMAGDSMETFFSRITYLKFYVNYIYHPIEQT